MRATVATLAPLPLADWGLAGPPCRFLTGDRFVHQTIYCARSFEWACGTHVRIEIFGDGTLQPEHAALLRRSLPGAMVIDEADTVRRLDRLLPAVQFPTLRRMRDHHPLMRKLLDLHAGFPGPSLYLDSDMLFFHPPVILREWLRRPHGALYMEQEGNALVGDPAHLGALFGATLAAGVNTGIVAVDDREFDWTELEQAASRLGRSEQDHIWAEQTLTALHLSRHGARPLPQSEYRLCHSRADLRGEPPALRHYVHKSKALYAASEWLLWEQRAQSCPAGPPVPGRA